MRTRSTAGMVPRCKAPAWMAAAALIVHVVAGASPATAREAGAPVAVWLDTDPACGRGATDDVDDCWALLLALRSPRLAVRGVGTVFGNAGGAETARTARAVVRRFTRPTGHTPPPVFEGASAALGPHRPALSPASRALAAALRRERLTVIALGPLTNIAALLVAYPDLAPRIRSIVAVAGRRPGQIFFPGRNLLFHFHDLNFKKDPRAFRVVLGSGVPLTLLPFEAAATVTIGRRHVERLARGDEAARWLARASAGWLSFWRRWLRADGFHPFDSLAVAYVAAPALFSCHRLPAVVRDEHILGHRYGAVLEVSHRFGGGAPVTYCWGTDPRLADRMIEILKGRAPNHGLALKYTNGRYD